MNWKTEAIEKLGRYNAMRRAAQNIPAEITRLETEARSLRGATIDPFPAKGGTTRGDDRLVNNLALRQELQWSLDQARLWLQVTEDALDTLDQEERTILQKMYISPEEKAVEQLCGQLCVERSSVYRRCDRALKRFTIALYGGMES